jgi:hypothetical protein
LRGLNYNIRLAVDLLECDLQPVRPPAPTLEGVEGAEADTPVLVEA